MDLEELTIGDYLRRLRLLQRKTQGDVAEAYGCSVAAYSQWETGIRRPTLAVVVKLAAALGGDLHTMLLLSDVLPPEVMALLRQPAEILSLLRPYDEDRTAMQPGG